MARTPDMFQDLKPPRKKPRVLMHVFDAFGNCSSDDDTPGVVCKMLCMKCKFETEWLEFRTITEAKRGIPCEACNKPETVNQGIES